MSLKQADQTVNALFDHRRRKSFHTLLKNFNTATKSKNFSKDFGFINLLLHNK